MNSVIMKRELCCLASLVKSMPVAFAIYCIMLPTISAAVPIGDIDIGDSLYINNVFSENDLVVAKRIDKNRGLVKVQYATGEVDWIAPSKLYTKTGSKNADTEEAIVGAALVAEALWAIFDPDGFKQAMSNNNSNRFYSSQSGARQPKEHQKTTRDTYDLSAVPFSPMIEGSWSNEGKQWIDWSEKTLKNELGKYVDIESVRTKRIPFYSKSNRNVVLAEAVQVGRAGAYYIIAVTEDSTKVVLNGNGDPIHEMNKLMALSINSDA